MSGSPAKKQRTGDGEHVNQDPHGQKITQGSSGKQKVALITGITGQDGSYLTECLMSKGYAVHGIIRRSSSFNTGRLHHIYKDPHQGGQMHLHYGDLGDATNVTSIMAKVRPDEVYNLGAQSHVAVSFEMPEYTADVDALGCLRLLDAIRACGLTETTRFYQASTSELYGMIQEPVQNEKTPFYPRSPYAVAKQFAYWMVINYREAYKMHASNGILFNHESPRRGPTFVTRKITRAVAGIHQGKQEKLFLGNLNAKRDWGHARDYVEGMWRIMQTDTPDDFVLATNQTHSVREFVELAFACINMTIVWSGEGTNEVGTCKEDGKVRVCVDPRYYRPTEVELLLGDASKAKRELGWEPTTKFLDLVKEMVESDIELMKHGDHN